MKFLRTVRALFDRKRLENEMAEEMRMHLELLAERKRAGGMTVDEAPSAAQREFGGVEQIKERCREQRGWAWAEEIVKDFKFGFRGLGRTPGFTVLAALTLALGIGLTTSIFSVIYGVLLEPYPYAKSNEIWAPYVFDAKTNRRVGLRISDYLEIAKLPAVQSAMATGYGQVVTLSGGLNPEIVTSPQVTGTAFSFLDVPPLFGRGLTPADFGPDGEPRPVVVLSFQLWQRLFNGDPHAIGRTLTLDDVPHAIVGVMPPRFGWYTDNGLWRPLSTHDLTAYVAPIVRLKPGVTPEVANQQLFAMLHEQARREPERFPKDGFTARFFNYLDVTVASGDMRLSLITLLFAVGFLLLMVCTNVANLQLARGVGRGRELAVRVALGAGRGRIFRQLITESLTLSLGGGVLGVGLAFGLVQIITLLLPPRYVPNEARITLNGWVLAFSAGVAMLTGILAGVVPAWRCSKVDVNEALKDGGQGAGGSRRGNRTRGALVVAQVALSVVLLVGATLSARSFLQMQWVDRGLQTKRMLLLRIPLNPKRYTQEAQRTEFARDFIARIRTLPGVTSATWGLPPGLDGRSAATIPGQPKPPGNLDVNFIDADYLKTYGIALKAGRNLAEHEVADGAHVALITEAAAKLWANGESPLGRTVALDALAAVGPNHATPGDADKVVTVVGIVADTHPLEPQRPPPTAILVPYTLRAPLNWLLVAHTGIEPTTLLNSVRASLRALDKEQPMDQPLTFERVLQDQMQQPRFNVALLGALGGIALMLAAAGIYGVLAYAVAQRTREIGVRMALGANRAAVLRLFFGLGGRLLAIGLVIGVALSLALAQIAASQVFRGPTLAPLAFAAAVALLSSVALVACFVPARRAAKVDPMVALRCE